jgi:hypothetical protein
LGGKLKKLRENPYAVTLHPPLISYSVPIIFFSSKDGTFPFLSQKTGTFVKIRDTKQINKKNSVIHYILNIEKFKHIKMSSKLLILHLRFAITIWMKTDKFSQAVTTQHNGQQECRV